MDRKRRERGAMDAMQGFWCAGKGRVREDDTREARWGGRGGEDVREILTPLIGP